MKFAEYKNLDLVDINLSILERWKKEGTFEKTLSEREEAPQFIFHEGPPSANGMPGIHHVMARAIKDTFCRYKSQKGYRVERKAGWDTHGLPVELSVEKSLGITKEDIGTKLTVEEYNNACRREVMKYTGQWEELTNLIGYWVDMEDPYITYDNRYIETLWYLLKKIYDKGLLYKGYTIQPYSPAAGTGLSTHELNQPGCYRDVKDTTCVVQFEVIENERSNPLFLNSGLPLTLLAWTTTPWTLPSNTALCVGPTIEYLRVHSFNPYSGKEALYIVASNLLSAHFNPLGEELPMEQYRVGDKVVPYRIVGESLSGKDLEGISYRQLIPWINPGEGAFKVLSDSFVTTTDGTGIVHIAPTFGADDQKVAAKNGVPPLVVIDSAGNRQALVDRSGRLYPIDSLDSSFVEESVDLSLYSHFAGRFVKSEYSPLAERESQESLDVDLAVMLKKEGSAFKIERYTHSYPHCWRTDKPILYYPLDSWFIKSTAVQQRMIELNQKINWKPPSTGSGRFGKWLENLQDWNLSRSRFWGTPLPIWRSEDGTEEICVGSAQELYNRLEEAVAGGVMEKNPLKECGFLLDDHSLENYQKIDLHRPFVDELFLISPTGKKMVRESDLIDVWFDSGAMPFAQEGLEKVDTPAFGRTADFIAEGVDQTRGWFFTLHAIATIVKDDIAFKNVISNGLVLDKAGNKMSKRLGNAVDPFKVLQEYGADSLRWYMLTNAQPWDNLKFDISGVDEVKRKFFGTLYNTYSFFALYANIDKFDNSAPQIELSERPEIDRWILSLLNSLIEKVDHSYENWDATTAGRAIAEFVNDHLSNWYVRLNRKRFWGGEKNHDKLSAYQTLYSCLEQVAIISAPIAPFFMERLFLDLNSVTSSYNVCSVHLVSIPNADKSAIDLELEERMALAQRASSLVLALRRRVNIKVRQPLSKMLIPITSTLQKEQFEKIKELVLSEVNVKEVEYIEDTKGLVTKKIKPNFKILGKRYGKQMKEIAAKIALLTQEEIASIESGTPFELTLSQENKVEILLEDVEILSEDMPGWLVATDAQLTVALDITVTPTLRAEGTARELINRIQNLRKNSGFEVTDKIEITVESTPQIEESIALFREYICNQTLALSLESVVNFKGGVESEWEEERIRIEIKSVKQ